MSGEAKSGTTYLEVIVRTMLRMVCSTRNCTFGADDRIYWARNSCGGEVTFDTRNRHMFRIPVFYKYEHPDTWGHIQEPPVLTQDIIQKTAEAALLASPAEQSWLVLLRDPRDVTISTCYDSGPGRKCKDPSGFMKEYVERISRWIELRHRLFKAIERMQPGRVIFVFYEDLMNGFMDTFTALGQYFGVPVPMQLLQDLAKATTPDAMRKQEFGYIVRNTGSCKFLAEISKEVARNATERMRKVLSEELNQKWVCE